MMFFVLSKEAENDLTNIWLYTFENWSIEQTDRYLNLLIDEIEYLCSNPESGSDFDNVGKGYFRTKVKSHLIFYKISKKQNEIEFIRILHEMMDIESHI